MNTYYIDTNIFLNVIYNEPHYVDASIKLLDSIQRGEATSLTASITETEIGLDLARTGNRGKIDEALRLIERMANLRICPLDTWTARLAVSLVLDHGMTVHDAYHAASALENKASIFVTRDRLLKKKLDKMISVSEPEALVS